MVSHELKHPLNLIQVSTELLVNQPEVRQLAAAIRAGDTIKRAVASQTKIINDLLDLSRARTGKLALQLEAVDLGTMISSIADAASEASRQKGISLQFESGPPGLTAYCDQVRTEQIFWNLINNAIKFTPSGGWITVSAVHDGEFARVSVADSGQGIAPEFLPRVFDMFSQAPNQSSLTQRGPNAGLGVGLALVHNLAVAQGGKVLAESPGRDQGATFSVWLPLNQGVASLPAPLPPANSLLGRKVLAVDDMRESLEPFAELLRIEGAAVDIAASGTEALEMLESKHYDLLISDLGMDSMDGYELMRKVRGNPQWASLQALALSGFGRQVDIDRALRAGFNGHLSKPASVAEIRQAVAHLPARS